MYDVSSTGTVFEMLERKYRPMSTAQLVLTIIIFIACLFLICVVLLQSGKNSGVAGSDTFLSNHKKNTWDAKLARITKWVSFIFMAAVLVLNLI